VAQFVNERGRDPEKVLAIMLVFIELLRALSITSNKENKACYRHLSKINPV